MTGFLDNRNDFVFIMISLVAVFVASVLSTATLTNRGHEYSLAESADPFDMAEVAANAGIEAAMWHIQTHGWTEKGSLSPHYHLNGAMYFVEWEDVNFTDSTVVMRSRGEYFNSDNQIYKMAKEKIVKLTFLPHIRNDILYDYYSENRPEVIIEDAR